MKFEYHIVGQNTVTIVDTEDKEFKQRAEAIQKALGATGYEVQPVAIFSWAPEADPVVPKTYGAVLFHGLRTTGTGLAVGGTITADALGLLKFPEAALRDLVRNGGVLVNFNPDSWKFIDPDDAVADKDNPIGAPWPTHWNQVRNGRKMYHVSQAFRDNPGRWPVGTLDKPQEIIRKGDGRYTLFQWWEGNSANLFGQATGRMEFAWEKDMDLS